MLDLSQRVKLQKRLLVILLKVNWSKNKVLPIEFEHNGQSKIVTIGVILLPSSNRRRKQSVSLMRFDQFYLDLWIALFAFAIGTLERKIYLLLLSGEEHLKRWKSNYPLVVYVIKLFLEEI